MYQTTYGSSDAFSSLGLAGAPADLNGYAWPADELARFNDYMSSTAPLGEWPTPDKPEEGVARNGADPSQDDTEQRKERFRQILAEVMRGGLYIAQRNTLIRAIRDPELKQRHHVILAEIILASNTASGLSCIPYSAIAETT